nr:Glutamate synthase [NADPH] large chain precursor [Klebsiella pneumoniae]
MVSRIGGASFDDFQQDLLNLSKRAGWRVSRWPRAVC